MGFVNEFNNSSNKITVKEILGVKVYDRKNLDDLVKKYSIKNIIFTKDLNLFDDTEKDLILDKIFNQKLKVLILNSILTSGNNNNEAVLKNVDIEDLLKRKTILPIKDLLLKYQNAFWYSE